ncbi:hypothetical protein DNJ72_05580 [Prochlorococcus marinus XMU1403]|uniref:hypothetical protein n=1 Tax=Prochlorococcus marinus TaxID=1219 RepID=UPI000D930E8B|nr:hypothetical protein [Prochlorococcus marinus str. MU1403]PYE01808.1 hypothetical protein DNJ72_05580 [Prochlorococcus marinus XMU1403]
MTFRSLLLLAHLQAFLIPIIIGIKSRNKFKQIRFPLLTPFAFISLGLASMFEMFDHTTTDWIYVDHSSIYNWLFYSFLSIGLSFFTISVAKNKSIITSNILLIIAAVFSYWFLGKSTTILIQVLISILLISQWWSRFKDWLFLIYPITGVIFTTFFGILLSSSGEQIWHLFIGPSGTISVLTFYAVLKRSREKEIISA